MLEGNTHVLITFRLVGLDSKGSFRLRFHHYLLLGKLLIGCDDFLQYNRFFNMEIYFENVEEEEDNSPLKVSPAATCNTRSPRAITYTVFVLNVSLEF